MDDLGPSTPPQPKTPKARAKRRAKSTAAATAAGAATAADANASTFARCEAVATPVDGANGDVDATGTSPVSANDHEPASAPPATSAPAALHPTTPTTPTFIADTDTSSDRPPLNQRNEHPAPPVSTSAGSVEAPPSKPPQPSKNAQGASKPRQRVPRKSNLNPKQKAVKGSLENLRDWDKRIFAIQTSLFDGAVDPHILIDAVKHLRPDQYQEVIVERAASRLCGYPLCSGAIQNLPGRYRISHKELKVYDITELKSFCSATCYASSKFVENQLPEEPVFLRNLAAMQIDLIPLGTSMASIENLSKKKSTVHATIDEMREEYVRTLLSTVKHAVKQPVEVKILERELVIPDAVEATAALKSKRDTADTIEGFRIRFRRSRSRKADTDEAEEPTTEVLPEYAERRKLRDEKSVVKRVSWADLRGNGDEPNSSATELASESAASNDRPEVVVRCQSERNPNLTGNDSQPRSTKPIRQSKPRRQTQKPTLSAFGRAWTLIESMITEETRAFMNTGAEPDPVIAAQNLLEWGVDLEALVTRRNIFSQKLTKAMNSIRVQHGISMPVADDCIAIVSTMYLRQLAVVLSPPEERIMCLVLLNALSHRSPPLKDELSGKWASMVEGSGLGVDEVEALARSFRRL
ncbi:Rtr1/RPAP2 family-domain-containing protein [Zopfochytrium polystomum]|nr:Rtr1/RPAP2 family-domain-containing protein [Zopfochytrium polystomum]